ncbi:MAG: PhoH family protein [Deltaproteobacteria bacterium]|jgi:PhoH-like ATPase|nr:PhoH family protein [Deltaproteobacteria bacterium]MBT4527682.1 PhoH family protein [Deltaproteobacteria bacterium]
MSEKKIKKYILDASVLLHDPESIYAFPESHVIIPIFVLEEIDYFKKEITETGRSARIVTKLLDNLREKGSLTDGVPLDNKSVLSVYVAENKDLRLPAFLNPNKNSNKVLAVTRILNTAYPENTILVTNDINLRIRVASLGIQVVPYENQLPNLEKFYQGIIKEMLPENQGIKLRKQGFIKVDPERYHANQNVLLFSENRKEDATITRYIESENKLETIVDFTDGVWGIKARNIEQAVALDFLMDPAIDVVILAGKAGTGKTLLALAAALEQMLSQNIYEKVLVSRPIFPMGKDMGYLPGDIEQKMQPWMQPIFDNLEFLSSNQTSPKSKSGGYQKLLDMGLVETEPLTYIRGRSIPHRFMIVDEAQNLTPHELKTIVTRVGEGTKLVLTGDPYQIDNPYMDVNSNGLSHVIENFQKFDLAGHVNLIHGVRSKLAELASNVL